MSRTSPIKLECEWLIPPAEALQWVRERGTLLPSKFKTDKAMARSEFRICKWRCRGKVRAARFTNRRTPSDFMVVHPSTKGFYPWQMSKFDKGGAYGDRQGNSCDELVQELRPDTWRLREVQ